MLSEKKQNYILEGIPKIGLFTLRNVPIIPYMLNLVGGLSSLRPCDQGTSASSSSSKVQSLVHTNRIPLFYKKILARIMLSETKTSRLFIFYCLIVNTGIDLDEIIRRFARIHPREENATGQYPAVWMTQKPRKRVFRELKSEKFPGEACPRTSLETCAFGVRR